MTEENTLPAHDHQNESSQDASDQNNDKNLQYNILKQANKSIQKNHQDYQNQTNESLKKKSSKNQKREIPQILQNSNITPNILVVDDDTVTRRTLSKLLSKLGYNSDTASGGKEALDKLTNERNDEFHLMLVDVMMPEMDGFSFMRLLKQAIDREVPTIMMSGSEDPDTVAKSFQCGAEDFLQKPIKEEILRARIQAVLESRDLRIRVKFYLNEIHEEKKLKEQLYEQEKQNEVQLSAFKKKVNESIQTPVQLIMETISDLMSEKIDHQQTKLALISIMKSLSTSGDLYQPAFVDTLKSDLKTSSSSTPSVSNMDSTKEWLVDQYSKDADELVMMKTKRQKSRFGSFAHGEQKRENSSSSIPINSSSSGISSDILSEIDSTVDREQDSSQQRQQQQQEEPQIEYSADMSRQKEINMLNNYVMTTHESDSARNDGEQKNQLNQQETSPEISHNIKFPLTERNSTTSTSSHDEIIESIDELPFDLSSYRPDLQLKNISRKDIINSNSSFAQSDYGQTEQNHCAVQQQDEETKMDLFGLNYDAFLFSTDELKKHVMFYFKWFNLFEIFNINPMKLWNLLVKLRQNYKPNCYHNFRHAMDVTQYLFMLLNNEKIKALLTDMDRFVLLVSGLCHDLDHPGVNNNFLINAEHDLAYRYNDKSVLENYHCAFSFKIFMNDTYNILDGLDDKQFNEFRKNMIAVVLSTDMSQHFSIISQFESRITTRSLSAESSDDRQLLMKYLMKTADINNMSRPFEIAKKWANMYIREICAQGDLERKKGLPISPYSDPETVDIPKTQIEFGKFVVSPLHQNLVKMFPDFKHLYDGVQYNIEQWRLIYNQQQRRESNSYLSESSYNESKNQDSHPSRQSQDSSQEHLSQNSENAAVQENQSPDDNFSHLSREQKTQNESKASNQSESNYNSLSDLLSKPEILNMVIGFTVLLISSIVYFILTFNSS